MTAEDSNEGTAAGPSESRVRKARRGRWGVPILIGGLVHLGAFAVLYVPMQPAPRPQLERPSIQWVVPAASTADSMFAEQLIFFDHAPLFLPTQWNYAGSLEPTTVDPSPADIFEPYEDQLHFEAGIRSLPAGLAELPPGGSSREVLSAFSWPYFDAFGRVDDVVVPLESRLARIEIRSARSGELMHVETVPADRVDAEETWPDWRPFDLFVSIAAEGPVAVPMSGGVSGTLAAGSATPEVVTDFFRRYLRRDAGLELLLPAGFYRVTVGP